MRVVTRGIKWVPCKMLMAVPLLQRAHVRHAVLLVSMSWQYLNTTQIIIIIMLPIKVMGNITTQIMVTLSFIWVCQRFESSCLELHTSGRRHSGPVSGPVVLP
jgi:hypothetical protein